MEKAARYVPPSKRAWWVNAAFIVIWGAVAFTITSEVEKRRNPANFDLETLQKIDDMEQMVYQKYRDEDSAQ